MTNSIIRSNIVLAILLFCGYATHAQNTTVTNETKIKKEAIMKMYLIEREIPGAGKLTPEQLKAISQTSCGVIKEMGPVIKWIHSYVTGDKIYCIYQAENEKLIKEHARKGGFPANKIVEIGTTISPATAN